MALVTYPLNNIQYSAEDAELFHCTRTSGVFAADEDFSASVSGANNTMSIGQGIAWIRNSRFSGKVVANKSSVDIDMGLADGTYPRIDAVVLRFDANKNETEIVKKEGTAASSPVAPEVVQTEAVYELHLYHVYRRAGATSILASDITDLRPDVNYCGVMSDDVTMLGDDFVNKDMIGVANGVASLDSSGKVPSGQLPSLNYIPTSQKGAKSGVATLDASGKVPSNQLMTKTTLEVRGDNITTTLNDGSVAYFITIGEYRVLAFDIYCNTLDTAQKRIIDIDGVPAVVRDGYGVASLQQEGFIPKEVVQVFSDGLSLQLYPNDPLPQNSLHIRGYVVFL